MGTNHSDELEARIAESREKVNGQLQEMERLVYEQVLAIKDKVAPVARFFNLRYQFGNNFWMTTSVFLTFGMYLGSRKQKPQFNLSENDIVQLKSIMQSFLNQKSSAPTRTHSGSSSLRGWLVNQVIHHPEVLLIAGAKLLQVISEMKSEKGEDGQWRGSGEDLEDDSFDPVKHLH